MRFIGVGKSTNRDAEQAGREAASRSLEGSPKGPADLALVFATAGYDQQELLRGISEITGTTPLSGCSTSGVITRDGADEGSHAVAVMVIRSNLMTFETYQARGLAADPHRCGVELADQILEKGKNRGRLLLLFPDGVTGSVTELISAFETRLSYPIAIAGGTAGELLRLNQTWQYHNGVATSDAVSAVLISGDFDAEIMVTHGCEPIGTEQMITRAENGWIYEIDGKPAWSVYKQYLDIEDVKDLDVLTMSHVCYICLAERLPKPDPLYGEYIIRCPLQLDRKKEALFFPGNLKTGTRVRMALRSIEQTVSRAIASAQKIIARHPGRSPMLMLQFDCCCRGRLLFGEHTKEATIEPLRRLLGPETPWFGFNTYGEIAPLLQRTYFHNYSAVLCALYPRVPK